MSLTTPQCHLAAVIPCGSCPRQHLQRQRREHTHTIPSLQFSNVSPQKTHQGKRARRSQPSRLPNRPFSNPLDRRKPNCAPRGSIDAMLTFPTCQRHAHRQIPEHCFGKCRADLVELQNSVNNNSTHSKVAPSTASLFHVIWGSCRPKKTQRIPKTGRVNGCSSAKCSPLKGNKRKTPRSSACRTPNSILK